MTRPIRPLLWLTCACLILHLLVLEWLVRSQPGLEPLRLMNEPAFDQSLQPGQPSGNALPLPDAQTLALNEPPPSKVGQVVLARTLVAPPTQPTQPTPPAQATRPSQPRPPAPPPPAAAAQTPSAEPVPQATGPTATTGDDPSTPTASEPPAPALAQAQPPAEHTPAEPPPPPLPATQSAASAPAPNTTPAPTASPSATSSQKLETTADWLRTWPADTRLSYSLKGYFRGDLLGDARVQWQRVDDQYQTQVAVTIGLFANIRLTSQGRITPTRLWPEVYEENRLGKHRLARMGQQQVTLSDGSTLPRPALLQDTASQFVQLSQDFAFGRLPLKVGAVIPVTLARPGGIDEWIYDVVALDNLATPLGELPAFHLQPRPQPNPRNNVSAEMWFAPSLQHLPVRIRLTLNADTWLDLTVKEVAQTTR